MRTQDKISVRLVGLFLAAMTGVVSCVGAYGYWTRKNILEHELQHSAVRIIKRLSIGVPSLLWNFDKTQLDFIVGAEMEDLDISGISIRDLKNEVVSGKLNVDGKTVSYNNAAGPVGLKESSDLFFDDNGTKRKVGTVEVVLSYSSMDKALAKHINYLFMQMFFADVTLAFFLMLWLRILVLVPLHRVGKALSVIASGEADLTKRLEVRKEDEIGLVATSFNSFVTRLQHIVISLRESTGALANVTAEIASGNHDLSSRTERQASVLEETSASMEELSVKVKENFNNAKSAKYLAQNSADIATKGGAVVGNVITTMQEINESSKRISEIISVIDGIAFQTNILALNAAVEAARAGDHGRGFAVVATEVRALAGRSANAAKEIKMLINASVEKVEQGTMLVDEAGSTMTEIVTSIQKVTDIMVDITNASQEQSEGVLQIEEAINQMDNVTQQNAALVEQMAAAASALNTQAEDLVKTISIFKV